MKGKRQLYPVFKEEFDDEYSPADIEKLKNKLTEREKTISSIFIQAVNEHDGEMIMNLARAAWFFKDKRPANFAPADRERALLLMLKLVTKHTGETLSIRQVAQYLSLDDIAHGKDLPTSEDGFSAIRRKCRQLGIPLVESRKRKTK